MAHSHRQDHDHADGQSHGHVHGKERQLGIVALMTGAFMLAEIAGGLLSGSLALIADAGHMLTDFASLALAWGAARIARRPADWKRTYGFDRFSVLAAFVNGVALLVIAVWIVAEAIGRFLHPVEVAGAAMLAVAALGLAVNIAAAVILHGGHEHDLNLRGALLHVLGDLFGSVAAIAAAVVILLTGWYPIDPLLSILVVVLIVVAGWRVVRDSGHILLEAVPAGQDPRAIAADLTALAGIESVHHVHVWSISETRPMITLQVRLGPGADPAAARETIRKRLESEHGIGHATIETEQHGSESTRIQETPT